MELIIKILYAIMLLLLSPLILLVWFILALINGFNDSSDNYYGGMK